MMGTRSSFRVWPLAILLLALFLRLAFVLTLDPRRLYWPDEKEFDEIAWRLAQGEGYISPPHRANPALPMALAAVYRIFGHSYVAGRVMQALLGAGLCVLVYWLTSQICSSPKAAVLAGALSAVYPGLIYLTGVFYAENMLAFWMAAGMAFLCAALRGGSIIWSISSGGAWAIAALARPVCLPFLLIAPILLLLHAGRTREPEGRVQWPAAILFLFGAALFLGPWCIRNYFAFDRFILVSTGGGKAFWMGNNELSRGDSDDRYLDIGSATWQIRLAELPLAEQIYIRDKHERFRAQLASITPVAQEELYAAYAWEHILREPARAALRSARRILTLYSAWTPTRTQTEHTSMRGRIIAALSFYPILGLGVLGFFFRRREWRESLPLYLLIAVYTLTHAFLTAATRFRLPLDPYWIALASSTLFHQRERGPKVAKGRVGRDVPDLSH